MRQWLILIAVVVLGLVRAHAQVEIYIDESSKADTVIVFGVTSINRAVTRSFTVRNATDSTVRIIPSRTDMLGQQSPVVSEFEGLFGTDDIASQATKSLNVRYRADFAFFPADSLAEVRLVLDVVVWPSQRPLQQKILILRGLKTGNVIGTVQRNVRFDSVYTQAPAPRRITYTVQNLLPVRFGIASQTLKLRTPALGPKEIDVDTFPFVEFSERGTIDWQISYRPRDRGIDKADFELRYTNPDNARDTIVTTRISGIGVEQQIELTSAAVLGVGKVVLTTSDTVFVGEVPATSRIKVAIQMRNVGNVPVHVDTVSVTAIKGEGAYSVSRPIRSINVADADTLVIAFTPPKNGEYTARIDLLTDLARRGFGPVPDSAVRRSFVIVGRAQSVMRVTPELLALGPVFVGANCSDESITNIEITNTGGTDVRVDSIDVTPPDVGLSVDPQQFILLAGASRTLQCRYRPSTAGRVSGEIILHLSGNERTRSIAFTSTARTADTLAISIPGDVSARPGSVVNVPVVLSMGTALGLQRASIVLDFNPSVAQISAVRSFETASSNALVSVQPRQRGAVVTIRDDAGLGSSDILITLQMRLFLGDSAWTRVVVDPDISTIGSGQCPDLMPLRTREGRVSIDSVCGLSYKTVTGAMKSFRAGVLPNPAFDVATVAVIAKQGNMATVDVLDAFGRPCTETVQVVCSDGVTTASVDVSKLTPAAYAVVVRMGDGMHTIPLVVQR
jgi:hypothetical protein